MLNLLIHHLRMVEADRVRREEGEEVEVLAIRHAVVQPGAVALVEIDDDRKPVHEDVAAESRVDVGGSDLRAAEHDEEIVTSQVLARPLAQARSPSGSASIPEEGRRESWPSTRETLFCR
jgi:hypothetical protein